MRRGRFSSLVTVLGLTSVCAADGRVPPSDGARIIAIDARAPWKIDGPGLKDLRPCDDDPRCLRATLTDGQTGMTLVRLRPAALAEVSRRWPVDVTSPFDVRVEVRREAASPSAAPRCSAYVKDAHWRFHEKGKRGFSSRDVAEVGIAIHWDAVAPALRGELVVRIERLALRVGPRHKPLLPPEGERLVEMHPTTAWRPDDTYRGVTGVRRSNNPSAALLTCDLDSADRRRRSGIVWIELRDGPRAFHAPWLGAFGTARAPAGLTCRNETAAGVSIGLRDADGHVFWGRSTPFLAADPAPPERSAAASEPTTAGVYPEMRFPMPLSFCSERFDASQVAAVGVRVAIDDRERATFAGDVTLDSVRIVAAPRELQSAHDAIAVRLGEPNWMGTIFARATASQRAAATAPVPQRVPIHEFLANVGVNYPWPAGVYPGVGARTWDATRGGFSDAADKLREDFAYLAAHGVRLVRVFVFCDGRTGIVANAHGRLALDAHVVPDVQALLDAAETVPTLRLMPVLFDYPIADGFERSGLAIVGEHPTWITDAAKRAELLDAIGPVIEMLCRHPQVVAIDLMNEPEHAAAAPADAMRAFLAALTERVRRQSPSKPATIGSASAIYAPYWQTLGLDFPSAHWFERIELSHPLGQRSAALDANATIVSEVDPSVGVETALETLWRAGYRGACFWSLNADDEYTMRGERMEAMKRWVERMRDEG